LHLMESGKILNLAGRNEYSIGRGVEGQSLLPDVDLSPFEAYSEGVSRLHATLKVLQHGILITDLGSSNGTRINGQKIVPHIDYPINHGDVVALGKLKMQILIQK
jgi:pSer/pThr/pTyr-binding forkhead associated (FHA) protein